jgi:thiamine biosynthesis lipoprotein
MVRVSEAAMGTVFEVVLPVGARSADYLEAAAREALEAVHGLEARLSHYLPNSEICDLNRRAAAEPVRLEPELFSWLQRAVDLSALSQGAFDVTAGPLVKAWGFFRGTGRLPDPDDLAAARERVGSHLLALDPAALTVAFRRPGVEVHLGAFGKGLAVDAAVEVLRGLGVGAALVHGGTSTVFALGAPPEADAWSVGLRDPRAAGTRLGVFVLRDRALSVSGDYEQFFEHEGQRYSHILDPRSGRPAQGVACAAFLAPSAADSDALSTAAFVDGSRGAALLTARNPEWAAVVIPDEDGRPGEPAVFGEAGLARTMRPASAAP